MNRQARRNRLNEFEKDKYNYKRTFDKMIFSANTEDIPKLFSGINKSRVMLQKINNIFCPKELDQMSREKYIFDDKVSLDFLVSYYLNVFKILNSRLCKYVVLKESFERALILEEYDSALTVLNEIESNNGVSIWSISKRFYLLDQIYGLEEHKKYLSKTLENVNVILSIILDLESYFSEENTTYAAYKKKVDQVLSTVSAFHMVRDYLEFKLLPERSLNTEILARTMSIDCQMSLIDMYETYVIAVQYLTLKNQISDGKIQNYNAINDKRLINYYRLTECTPAILYNNDYYQLLEKYTCGDYIDFLESSKKYTDMYPTDFQCILLQAKSYLLLQQKPQFHLDIHRWVYDIYAFDGGEEEAIQDMLTYLKVVKGTCLEYKVLGFIARKTFMPGYVFWTEMSVFNDFNLSPNIINFINIDFDKNRMLEEFSKLCPITTKLFQYKTECISDIPKEVADVNRKFLFNVDRLITKGQYRDALDEIGQINRKDNYMEERVLRRKILIFQGLNNYLSLVENVTAAILNNRILSKRMNLNVLYEDVNRHINEVIKRSLYYVVFVYLCVPSNTRRIQVAYTNYMEKNNYRSISELVEQENAKDALIFFLHNICTIYLLKRDTVINVDASNVEEIRIDVLKSLLRLDPEHYKKYYAEIINITKDRSIRERIRQINRTRIFVDTEGIKKEKEIYLKAEFERYISIKEFSEEIPSYDVLGEDYINKINTIVTDMNNRIQNSPKYSQKIIVLKEMITTIVEGFLFDDKYGLNTFLSSRIRHGYCKNQLIGVFQEHNLLSKKKTDNSVEYLVNEYWDGVLPENAIGTKEIKKYLSIFTKELEDEIDFVKKVWLNIKFRDESSNAFLDYTPVVNTLLVLDSERYLDFNAFYDAIIEALWQYTISLFHALQEKIHGELLQFFEDRLLELSNNLQIIEDPQVKRHVEMLNNNILRCKPKLQERINQFAGVFEKSDVDYMDFQMQDLVDTCLQIEKKLNVHMEAIQLNTRVDDIHLYKGYFFPYFVDVLTILLDNALEHSELDFSELELSINVESVSGDENITAYRDAFKSNNITVESMNYIKISVVNNFNSSIDRIELENSFGTVFGAVNDPIKVKKYSQSEGGTGLYKLYRTLNYNIPAPYIVEYDVSPKNAILISIVMVIDNIIVI